MWKELVGKMLVISKGCSSKNYVGLVDQPLLSLVVSSVPK